MFSAGDEGEEESEVGSLEPDDGSSVSAPSLTTRVTIVAVEYFAESLNTGVCDITIPSATELLGS